MEAFWRDCILSCRRSAPSDDSRYECLEGNSCCCNCSIVSHPGCCRCRAHCSRSFKPFESSGISNVRKKRRYSGAYLSGQTEIPGNPDRQGGHAGQAARAGPGRKRFCLQLSRRGKKPIFLMMSIYIWRRKSGKWKRHMRTGQRSEGRSFVF